MTVLTDEDRVRIVQSVVSESDRPIGMVAYGCLVAKAIEAATIDRMRPEVRFPMIFSSRLELATKLGTVPDKFFADIVCGVEDHHGISYDAFLKSKEQP